MEWLGVFEQSEPSYNSILRSTMRTLHGPSRRSCDRFPKDDRVKTDWESHGKKVEDILKYRFKNRELLFLALTSKSWAKNHGFKYHDNGFQRLEFLGDTIAGFVVVAYLFEQFPDLGPGALTELKGACVSNETFARVAVKTGLEAHYYVDSGSLEQEIEVFKKAINPLYATRKESAETTRRFV